MNGKMIFFYMNQTGDKIDKFLDFVDSNNGVNFSPKLREYIIETEGRAKES